MQEGQHTKTFSLQGYLFALIAAILWGVSGSTAQFLFHERAVGVDWLLTLRLLTSGSILLLLAKMNVKDGNIWSIWHSKTDVIRLIVFSTAGMLAVQYTYFAAINHSNAATATILQYTAPILIAIYLSIKTKRLPSNHELAAILLAVTGTFLLVTHGDIGELAISREALLFGIGSAITLGIYTLQPAALLAKYDATTVIAWGMLCAGGIFSLYCPIWSIDGNWDAQAVGYASFIVFFGTLIPFTLFLMSVKSIGGQKATLLASAEPLSAAVVSVWWLDTSFTWIDWLGSLCVVGTVFLLTRSK